MDDPLLLQAWKLHRSGRFSQAIALLEPQILRYRSDSDFYRILGLSCIRQGDWKGGETYLERSLQLDPEDRIQVSLALMAVAAKRKDFGEAVRLALEILDQEPGCRPAKRALARLRAALAAPVGSGSVPHKELLGFLPKIRKSPPWLKNVLPWVLGVVVLVPSLAAGIWWGWSLVSHASTPPAALRAGPDIARNIETTDLAQDKTGSAPARIVLTPDEIRQTFEKLMKLFQDYQDSAVRLQINRLLLSNASQTVKERVRGLLPYLHAPDFARPEESASYQDVRGFPELYEGCTVRWKGVISNLVSGKDEITFDLLLGYQDGQVVEGVIPVRLGFASLLKNSQVVEVLGRVALDSGKWYVDGTGLHAIGYRAP